MIRQLLTIYMLSGDGTAIMTEVGVMVDEPICHIAGEGFAMVLQAENPGMVVAWTCDPVGVMS